MGRYDNATKLFFSNRENFISVIRLFYGWDVNSESVDGMSERLFAIAEKMDDMQCEKTGRNKEDLKILEHERDVVRRIRLGKQPLIMGLENQQTLDCSEPIRVMVYDSMEYERQRRVLQSLHRERKDLRGDEYIAGFAAKDLVVPVHTLVIYYGKKPWERPKRLSDIWERNDDLPEEVQDYRLDVLDVRRLTDEQIDSIESDVRLLFGCVKYDEDPEKMHKFVEKNRKHFESMLPETFLIIATMTDSLVLQEKMNECKEKGERMNMCKAFEEWCNAARREGEAVGMQQGIIKTCKDLGVAKERVVELLKKNLSLEDAECKKYIEMYW